MPYGLQPLAPPGGKEKPDETPHDHDRIRDRFYLCLRSRKSGLHLQRRRADRPDRRWVPACSFTPPAINNLNSIIFGGYATVPIFPTVTYFAGLFSPQTHITSYTAPTDDPCLAPYAINDENQIAFVMDNKLSPDEAFVSAVYETTYTGGTVQTLVAAGSVVDGVTLLGNFCGTENGNNFAFDDQGRVAFNDTGGSYRYVPGKGVSKINPNQGEGRTIGAVTNDSARELVFQGSIGPSSAIFTHDYVLAKVPEKIEDVEVASIFETQVARGGQFVFLGTIGSPTADNWGLFTRDQQQGRSCLCRPNRGRDVSARLKHLCLRPCFGVSGRHIGRPHRKRTQ
jgi:hypothetical protein